MKITFLGSGGGRFSAISQRRMTGGFRLDNLGGKNYHIDPGPGALIRTYQFGFDPRNLSGILLLMPILTIITMLKFSLKQ